MRHSDFVDDASGGVHGTERRRSPRLSIGINAVAPHNLSAALATLHEWADSLHADVMDGTFCPRLDALGASTIEMAAAMGTPVEVHLMVAEPRRMLESMANAGAQAIYIHPEAAAHPHQGLLELRELVAASPGLTGGLAVNPGTPVSILEPFLEIVDQVLVLAVNPGFARQSPATNTARRISAVRTLAASAGQRLDITVDGGVTFENATDVAGWGADCIVTGTAIFAGGDLAKNLSVMRARLDAAHAGRILP